mmetsp:Transcript_20870/g.66091  ORF Transcript_20870/g.66091 Transcript_20870/m.66091 type:complete len:93 (-) Transcript_20870:944-1222(-)
MQELVPIDKYENVKDIGSGNFGVAKLMKDLSTGELVAVKYIERGEKIDDNVRREIINHRLLRHPNIIQFKEVRGRVCACKERGGPPLPATAV